MATSLLLLLDDITSALDDVALMTKVAAKKTAGVLGDDLALNAKQVTGIPSDRELPVVFQVACGSLLNKAILVPTALCLSWLLPEAITPLLVIGGAFLCFEGAEKVLHKITSKTTSHHGSTQKQNTEKDQASTPDETSRIRGAIRTDFILSAEIIVITLGVVASEPLSTKAGVLVTISVLMTVGVYGLVAAIIKLDDFGVLLVRQSYSVSRAIGHTIIRITPWIMRFLAIAGTVAMFLVGGGIVLHNISPIHHAVDHWIHQTTPEAITILMTLANGLCGIITGLIILAVVTGARVVKRT
ncbi:DUF808 domain-containing protein [Pirellulales bacterium]|nr:DUF808 domain-containing protein [Pirellulales bacterium]MDB4557037.1 DUF808 domain-containing protein [bacterium]